MQQMKDDKQFFSSRTFATPDSQRTEIHLTLYLQTGLNNFTLQ